ncbi:LysE family translocator [Nordella sp. HKS 07]|uniref:LysE family translocator n=1 Tax=Nordella sp. HKS 07 TaxID=2712222 RepID=UPI0013E1B839|nr:LysE family translocator [Nordella sp. HKS 07]QIG47516.1 LysE family translocator [Nordella sp. HKS 07]
MDLSALLIFAGALALAAGSPGPSIAALVARVISRGYGGVIPFTAAMWIGEAVWLALAVFGLSVLAQTFYWAFLIIKYLGLAYLVYLAYKMWTAPVAVTEDELPQADSSFRLFLTGLAITLGNPKIMVFYLALLPTIIDLNNISLIGWGELTATMFVVLAAIDIGYIVLAGRARKFIRSARAMRAANKCSALAMGSAAIVMATR